MITVHHLENSRSHRVLWLLEELGVPYEIKKYARDPETMLAPPELKRIHPLGKSPIVEIGGAKLVESGAILESLLERYDGEGRFAPRPKTVEHDRYRFWMHYAEGSAMPPLLLKLVFRKIRQAPVPFFVKPIVKTIAAKAEDGFIDPQLQTHFDFVESELGKSPWLVGDQFTAADVQMSFPIEAAVVRAGGPERPNMRRWVESIHQRDAYKRAIAKGGPLVMLG